MKPPASLAISEKTREHTMILREHKVDHFVLLVLHEALFSLSTAFLAISIMFLLKHDLSYPFVRLEVSINHLLGISQTDYIRGYFEYLLPSVIVAVLLGILLHIFSSRRLGKEILRSVAGGLLVLAPLIFWFCYYQVVGWAFGWPYRGAPLELVVAIVFMTLVLLRKWRIRWWLSAILFAAHYNFWYWRNSSDPDLASYAGPLGPILGCCSALAWGFYVARLARPSTPK
jgi:hypothetical protein